MIDLALRGLVALACLNASAALAQDAEVSRVGDPNEDRGVFFFDPDHGFATNARVDKARIVHPITAPGISEDPFITTDVRGTYFFHRFPNNGVLNGQSARIYDLQVRCALSEQFQVFVNKLGIASIDFPGSTDDGVTDVGVGIKYALHSDWETHEHVSIGASFELGISENEAFYGDDEGRFFATFASRLGDVNLSGTTNFRFGLGSSVGAAGESDNLSVHLHADYPLNDTISPVVELNYYRTMDNGDNPTPYSGVDLANFSGNEDEDVLTVGLGAQAQILDDVALRAAYESPLTDNEDLFGYRWTVSAVWRF